MGLHRSQSVWKESQVSSISNLLHKKGRQDKHSGGGKGGTLHISLFKHFLWKQITISHSGHIKAGSCFFSRFYADHGYKGPSPSSVHALT